MQQKQSLAEKLNYWGISTTLTMRNQLTNLNTNIEKVIGMLGDTSVNEQKAAKLIATHGGLHNIVFVRACLKYAVCDNT
jgi:diacylglycerol kinase